MTDMRLMLSMMLGAECSVYWPCCSTCSEQDFEYALATSLICCSASDSVSLAPGRNARNSGGHLREFAKRPLTGHMWVRRAFVPGFVWSPISVFVARSMRPIRKLARLDGPRQSSICSEC